MHYLQKKCGGGVKEHTFISRTGMPVDALHKTIKGESISGNMSKEAMNKFAKKISEFAGLEFDGLQEIVQEMTDDKGRGANKI